ncbi:MAG: 2Fe-2S iron-sulfur cluster binding domain-containing protein [Holosporales bacterium]|jgi:2Fe-2S ferredoxin|nr:2Fe-2S iron-sulfur cluster binding domain-containing protein [Holosporales bacterium]
MAKIIFKSESSETIVEATNGETLLEVANNNNIKLFGGCCGAGVCGTCQVFIDNNFINKLNEKTPEELDLLDVLPNGNHNSRLACQVIISDELDGMVVVIP